MNTDKEEEECTEKEEAAVKHYENHSWATEPMGLVVDCFCP